MKVPAYPPPPPPLETTGRNDFRFKDRLSHSACSRLASAAPGRPHPHARNLPVHSPPPLAAKPAPGLIYPAAFSESCNQWQTRSREPPRAQAEEVSPRHPPRTPRGPIPHRPGSWPPHFPGAPAREGCRGEARLPASLAPTHPIPSPRFRPC